MAKDKKIVNKKTILVVEDEKPLADAVKKKLEISGFDVVTARNVEQAINNWDDGKIENHELTQVEFLLRHINENIEKLQKYIISGIKDIGRK
jgi:DNA-binding NtrC family response regulator